MSKFVIGHMSYFDNVLKLTQVEDVDSKSALKTFLEEQGYEIEESMSIEDMCQEAFNGDFAVSTPLKISD